MRNPTMISGRAWIFGALWLAALSAQAAPVTGSFVVERTCPAYVSKNRQTNPGGVQVQPGQRHPAFEANRAEGPDWYRLHIAGASPGERWVSVDCGRFEPGAATPAGGTSPSPATGPACRVAGRADSHVLALSWQPAFCETRRHRIAEFPECRIDDPRAWQAGHFTLHGLWPNQRECGKDYGFCGEVKRKEDDFCDYPQVELLNETRAALALVMPSVTAGSCLERHEWHKHGTCQTGLSDDEYYALSVDLTHQFNDAGMAYFVNRRLGEAVRTEDFLARLDAVLGAGARQRVALDCQDGLLVEVRIALPLEIPPGEDLERLLAAAAPSGGSDCGDAFRVDPIGFGPS